MAVVRRMIAERLIAPIYVGVSDPPSDDFEECPICFLVSQPPFSLSPAVVSCAGVSSSFCLFVCVF
jgi:hypothetical protein